MGDPRSQAYTEAFAAVREVLNRLDPIGLIGAGAPANEYERQVTDLVRLVMKPEPFDEEVVDAIWRRWFGDDYTMVGGEGLSEQTRELAALQSRFAPPRP